MHDADPWLVVARLSGAFVIGFMGSVSYFTALYFKFIGVSDEFRDIILRPFRRKNLPEGAISFWKVVWYSSMGGFVAVIFQMSEPVFVALQNFLIGTIWPGIVSHLLSGRMESPTREEQQRAQELASRMSRPTIRLSDQSGLLRRYGALRKDEENETK